MLARRQARSRPEELRHTSRQVDKDQVCRALVDLTDERGQCGQQRGGDVG